MTEEPLSVAEALQVVAQEKARLDNVVSISPPTKRPACPHCGSSAVKKFGADRYRQQRFRCTACNRTIDQGSPTYRPLIRQIGNNSIPDLKVLVVMRLLMEGMSIRATSRLTGVHRTTICTLVGRLSPKIQAFNASRPRIKPSDVEVDEVWTFVAKKRFTVEECSKGASNIGAQWIYFGLDRASRAIVCQLVGRRNLDSAIAFMHKLRAATEGSFTVHTDGFQPYPTAVYAAFMERPEEMDRLSSPLVIVKNNTQFGLLHGVEELDATRSNTNHIERFNGILRQQLRRMARSTNAFSKTQKALIAHIELFVAHYNFCRTSRAVGGGTPAMFLGWTDHVWDMRELLIAVRDLSAPVEIKIPDVLSDTAAVAV